MRIRIVMEGALTTSKVDPENEKGCQRSPPGRPLRLVAYSRRATSPVSQGRRRLSYSAGSAFSERLAIR